jgi:outer membrane phospholipase A
MMTLVLSIAAMAALGYCGVSWSQSAEAPSESKEVQFARLGFSLYDPIYIIGGNDGGSNVKFQLSFKYQFFDEGNWLTHFYLSYTQTSLWDLDEDSSPFNDSSYKPRFFFGYDFITPTEAQAWGLGLEVGFAHESNGKSGAESRAINAGYARPTVSYRFSRDHRIYMAPMVYFAADINENPDIFDYRGQVDWLIGYGNGYVDGTNDHRNPGLNIWATFRDGDKSGYDSIEGNVALPFYWVDKDWRGWLLLQYFEGYGETLIDYNQKLESQFRLGYALTVQ